MKKVFKAALMLVIAAALIAALAVGFAACDPKDETPDALRVAAPEGTPALAIARLKTDNATLAGHAMTYEVVSPSLIAAEMSGGKADVVIMPVNAGANLIRQGADYRLISVAVNGSLFMVGSTEDGGAIEKADIAGSKVACIGQGATPGLVFEYVMRSMGLEIVADKTPGENQVAVQYVADGPAAKALLENDKVDFAVVGEPAATTFKNALKLNAELDMQAAWKDATDEETYPQAGLFVRTSLAADAEFISALFDALAASKEWVNSNPSEVGAFMKANLYESAAFPAPSISRCAIDAEPLGEADKKEILAFLSAVMPKAGGTAAEWDKVTLFA
ncbi:MAG TPA: hypothetical protein IAC73_05280 [Candidatus Limadaptatus stercoripullorum]|uniref:SsuA/THI5-like domain-containing protein n=1 Tax=Candidatus Limadaptatus stercoripullorum TaxID=2840846 RepID=A0A9D1NB08_9FIRM|nr:hypothetical protein [Candidatus Limadaptatus stercoripullorum]